VIRISHLFALAVLATSVTAWGAAQFVPGEDTTPPERPAPAQLAPPEADAPAPARPDGAARQRAPVIVNTTVSRTAVWVGNSVIYTIEITCPPGTDILVADISRDRLRLTGLQVSDATQQRETRPDGGIVYRAQFRLVSYVSDGSRVGIDAQSVRYYVHTAGQSPETLVPADEVELPAVTVTVRSVLPDGNISWIRDTQTIATLPSAVRFLIPVGVAAVMLTLVPVVVGLTTLVRNRKPRRTVRSRRETLQQQRQALADIRALGGLGDADLRRDVFDKLNSLIRDRLTELDIPAQTLTAGEIERAIVSRGKPLPVPAGEIAAVFSECERAVYGGADELPGPEAMSAALEVTERLLAAGVR
jgi:hypothetical protein